MRSIFFHIFVIYSSEFIESFKTWSGTKSDGTNDILSHQYGRIFKLLHYFEEFHLHYLVSRCTDYKYPTKSQFGRSMFFI